MLNTTIHDLTDEFLAPAIDWQLPASGCDSQFSERTRAIRDGLYLAVYLNDSPYEVWDHNGKNGDKAKRVIPANSPMLKYGKFEGGVLRRYQETFFHLRRRVSGGDAETWIHRDLVKLVLVLDLTPVAVPACSCARVFEPFWNASIEKWLDEHGFLAAGQGRRIESRTIRSRPTKAELMPVLKQLHERIDAAALALGQCA